jgi:heme/copper-type cytochrome/quinol oxidase subunit 1
MKQLFKKPYFIFWVFIIIIMCLRELGLYRNEMIINYEDTYYVIAQRNYNILLGLILFFLSLIYLIFDKLNIKLISILNLIHIIFTIIPILSYHLLDLYYSNSFQLFDNNLDLNSCLTFASTIVLVAQVVLIINILASLFKLFFNKN